MKKVDLIRLIVVSIILALGAWLAINDWAVYFRPGFGLLISVLTGLWLLSLLIKDASIIDIFWGTGFVIVGWFYAERTGFENLGLRHWLLLSLITIWGLRLSIYLAIRNIGKPEDYRYAAWRKEFGEKWWWLSFFRVFVLQGVLLWIISAIYVPALQGGASLGILDYLGIIFWSIGFFFEAVGDWQMMRFKNDKSNQGKVMNKGLWRYTRHPNYFGDAMIWWGYFFFGLAYPEGIYYIFCPIIMTFFLVKVSGVAMLEEGLKKTKPKYAEYIRKTSAFIPWFPKQ